MTGADDRRYMAAALRLARTHLGLTGTNPSVGCILVKDGSIIGTGVTAKGGRPHAETQALADAGALAAGATAYVTLEPCSHHGKTPPCADALIAAGIQRVVISVIDPDPRVSGSGAHRLQTHGISVTTGCLEREGRRLLSGYLARKIENRPEVILKLAVSLDGAVGRRGEGNVAVTGPLARRMTHAMRAEADAIMIGAGTAIVDDPALDCRLPGLDDRSPRVVVLDRRLTLGAGARLLTAGGARAGHRPIIVAGKDAPEERAKALAEAGAEVWLTGTDDLGAVLNTLAENGVATLLVEGGAAIACAFLAGGHVDRIQRFAAPVTIGGDIVAAPFGPDDAIAGFRIVRQDYFGPDRLDEMERI